MTELKNGVLPADWELYIPFDKNGQINATISIGKGYSFSLKCTPLSSETSDAGIIINSKSGYVEGYYEGIPGDRKKSNNFYTNVLSGEIKKIPVEGEISCNITGTFGQQWEFICKCKYY